MAADLSEYLWIAFIGGILGFAYGFLIGSNDVANAFASSVAAKSITLKQAMSISSIFKFGGAILLGTAVTGTICSKIVSPKLYENEPKVLMFGMMTSLMAACLMLFVTTHLGLPILTTHDIVGCIMGFTIAAKGFDLVEWKVMKQISMSWILSPLVAGVFGCFIFSLIKFGIMRAPKPTERAYYAFPAVLTVGIGIDLFYILYKGMNSKKKVEKSLDLKWVLPTSFGARAFAGLYWIFVVGPWAKTGINARRRRELADAEKADLKTAAEPVDQDSEADLKPSNREEHGLSIADNEKVANNPKEVAKVELSAMQKYMKKFADNTYNQDLHAQSMHENPRAAKLWDDGEKFDPEAEMYSNYIQVFTACLNSFAHGANDVSNTIAPLSAIIQIYQDGAVKKEAPVQKWVLAYGCGAIVLGLLLYGYRVMKSIGYKLTLMSVLRGASAKLAASLTVVTASFLEMPVSSTQCIVGAVSGVGLVGGIKNVQWFFLLQVCFGWLVMFVITATLLAGLFSVGAYALSLSMPVDKS